MVWPKFKNGEATVRDVKVKPNFEYVEDIYQMYIESQAKGHLGVAMQELSDMNPLPMNRMLERQSKEEAIAKRTERKGKTVKDVPPTTADTSEIEQPPQATKGKPRYCLYCL